MDSTLRSNLTVGLPIDLLIYRDNTLAVELARDGIRVNGVAPGYIRTAQLLSKENSLGPEGAEKAGEFIPMGRIGEPEDIAEVKTMR